MQCSCTYTCTGVGAHTGWPSECSAEERYNNNFFACSSYRPQRLMAPFGESRSQLLACSARQQSSLHYIFLVHVSCVSQGAYQVIYKCLCRMSCAAGWKCQSRNGEEQWLFIDQRDGKYISIFSDPTSSRRDIAKIIKERKHTSPPFQENPPEQPPLKNPHTPKQQQKTNLQQNPKPNQE